MSQIMMVMPKKMATIEDKLEAIQDLLAQLHNDICYAQETRRMPRKRREAIAEWLGYMINDVDGLVRLVNKEEPRTSPTASSLLEPRVHW